MEDMLENKHYCLTFKNLLLVELVHFLSTRNAV